MSAVCDLADGYHEIFTAGLLPMLSATLRAADIASTEHLHPGMLLHSLQLSCTVL